MNIQLNTNLLKIFTGTYATLWGEDGYQEDNQGALGYMEFDSGALMNSIIEAYRDNQEEIIQDMGVSFVKSINIESSWSSPKEYNFSTDTFDFTLTIDNYGMIKALDDLDGDQEFQGWLRDNFTDRDGFWSWTPSNYNDLSYEIKNSGDYYEQSIGALVTYLTDKKENLSDIEIKMWEYWQQNGYYGMEYTVLYSLQNKETSETEDYSTEAILEMVNKNSGGLVYDSDNWLEGLGDIGFEYIKPF